MDTKKSLHDYIYCLVVGGIFLYSINRAILAATFINIPHIDLFLIGLAVIFILLAILFNKYTRLFMLAVILLAALYFYFTLENFSEQYPHFYEIYLMVTGRLSYRPHLGRSVVWIISFLLGFAMVVFMFHQFSFHFLLVSGASVFIVTWISGFTRDEPAFLFFLFAACLILIRHMTRSAAKSLLALPLCAAVIFLTNSRMPMESEFFTVRNFNNSGFTIVNDFFHEIFRPVHFSFQTTGFTGAGGRLGGPITPNERFVMYVQAPGRTYLAGAISNTYTGERWLSTLEEGGINTHGFSPSHFEMLETVAALIRNATFATSDPNFFPEQLPSAQEELWHAERMDTRQLSVVGIWPRPQPMGIPQNFSFYWHTYLPLETVAITQGSNRSGAIFTPPRAGDFWFSENSYDYAPIVQVHPAGYKQIPGFMSRGTEYNLQFLNLDTERSFIQYILQNTNAGIYEAHGKISLPSFMGDSINPRNLLSERDNVLWRGWHMIRTDPPDSLKPSDFLEFLRTYTISGNIQNARGTPTILYVPSAEHVAEFMNEFSTILAEYARQVRQNFLYVPEIVPQRVIDLTMELIHGQTSDFGRVSAIRDYLLSFPYTLSPPHVPRGVCFVDHFLFEAQEGYCTYFASAMAVMSRIAGVPSRYVEGFVLPPHANPSEPFAVTNRMAHAWVEVYLEGFGWYLIEATPTYAFIMNPRASATQTAGNEDWLDRMQELISGFEPPSLTQTRPNRPDISHPILPSPPHEHEEYTDLESQTHVLWLAIGFLALIPLTVLIFFLSRRWQIKYRQKKIKKLSTSRQVKIYFNAIMDIVNYYYVPISPEETPQAYGKHMGKRIAFRSDTVYLSDIIELYYRAKYSPAEISPDETELMREVLNDMINLIRIKRSFVVYIYLRYVRNLGNLKI